MRNEINISIFDNDNLLWNYIITIKENFHYFIFDPLIKFIKIDS